MDRVRLPDAPGSEAGSPVDWATVDWTQIDFDTVDWERSTNKPKVDLPRAVQRLSEGEVALAKILQDRSGIELAELVFVDDSPSIHRPAKSRAYRLYPYQWRWWRCMDPEQIEQGARSLGKSESIIARACAFVANFPGQEFVIVTPEGSHADALTERLEVRLFGSRFMREMLAGGRRAGVTHHPFQALFANGARVFVRLPQRSGIGVKGIHPVVLEVDEGQDISERTWKELPEVVRKEIDGHMMRVHGVSKGVQDDTFFKKTQPGSGWTVHQLTKMMRPDLRPYLFLNQHGEMEAVTGEAPAELGEEQRKEIFKNWPAFLEDGTLDTFTTNDSEEAEAYAREHNLLKLENWRDEQAREYGGRNSPDFKRNVYGMHGEAMNRIFVLTRLMKTVDTREGSDYNTEEYRKYIITADQVALRAKSRSGLDHDIEVFDEDQAAAILEMVDLPRDHTGKYKTFWCGMDVGVIGDPSEILVWAEYVPSAAERRRDAAVEQALPEPGVSRFKLLTRIQLTNVAPDLQAHLIMHINDHYRPKAFSLDRTGNGIAILRSLQRMAGTARRYVFQEEAESDAAMGTDKELQGQARNAIGTIKGYNFSEKIVIEINEAIVEERNLNDLQDILDIAGIRQNVKDAATDVLRELVDQQRLMLPYDGEVINQMNGQTWMAAREPVDQYGKSRMIYSRGEFHILDAARMFALGMDKQPIEEIERTIRAPKPPVLDRFG